MSSHETAEDRPFKLWLTQSNNFLEDFSEYLQRTKSTLVSDGSRRTSALGALIRPIRRMNTQHIKGQIQYARRSAENLYGYVGVILPMLEEELARRADDDLDFLDEQDDQTTTRGNDTVNLKNMAALIREDITTIRVSHDNETKTYVYLCPSDLAQQLRARGYAPGYKAVEGGAQVLVRNRRGVTLGDVVEVHTEPQIDMDYQGQYRYAFALVDTSRVDQLEREDAVIYEKLKQQKKRSVRDQVLATLGITDTQQFLADLRDDTKGE